MVRIDNLHLFQRMYNGIMIHLRQDEWADDVPLPKDAVVFETGDGPFKPYWRLVLEPNQTVEILAGWFKVPSSLDQLVAWYQTEMEKVDWVKSKNFREGNSAGINFVSPDQKTRRRVEISILDRPDLGDSTVMIRRVITHPWSSPKGNPTGTLRSGTGAKSRTSLAAQTAARTPKGEKRRVPRKPRSRVVA